MRCLGIADEGGVCEIFGGFGLIFRNRVGFVWYIRVLLVMWHGAYGTFMWRNVRKCIILCCFVP